MHHVFRLSAIPARLIFIGIWAEIVFFLGGAYAQEKNIDTIHVFKADTVWLGFDDVLQLSSLYDSADKEDWHYIYRWNTGERTDAIQARFDGRRKVLYTGERLSDIHWPGEYDTVRLDRGLYYSIFPANPRDDTVILRALSPEIKGTTVRYEWSQFPFFDRYMLPDTEQCVVVYRDMWRHLGGPERENFYCRATALSDEGEEIQQISECRMFFTEKESDFVQTPSGIHQHNYNIWSVSRGTQIYARLGDTLHFFSEMDYNLYPEYSYWINHGTLEQSSWYVLPTTELDLGYSDGGETVVYFRGNLFRNTVHHSQWYDIDIPEVYFPVIDRHIYWGIKPNAEIETDSVWVFFPQYPYSNLGGRVDVCLPHDAPLPSAEDTVQVFNLGPWNRELEYVEYAWFDGAKDITGRDSVVGTDSVFYYTFGKMDSVSPELYIGTLATRVASDSLWQDTCNCYIPCTDDACNRYDTVKIYLHRLPLREQNFFLPQSEILCAHQDLELFLPKAEGYRCYWLDRDSVALPYGYDTARYTVQGMRGLDGYGAGIDTREPRFFQLRLDHKLCGVSYFDTLLVYDQVKPAFKLACHDTLICLDEPVKMDSLSPQVYRPFYIFEWNDGKKGSDYVFTDSGVYVLQFFVDKDFAVCGYDTASDTIRVRWSDPAQTRITLSDTSFCEKLSVTLDARVPFDSTRYCWQDGPLPDPEEEDFEQDSIIFTSPVKTFKEEGTYNISLLDTMGCINRKEIIVTIDDCSPKLDIPNVFTPNGDGVNDVWRFKQLEYCTDVKVEVVDRWGQPVLKMKVATADDFGWNGTINNKGRRLPDGPYFYMVTYKDVYGKSKVQSGSITILGTAE